MLLPDVACQMFGLTDEDGDPFSYIGVSVILFGGAGGVICVVYVALYEDNMHIRVGVYFQLCANECYLQYVCMFKYTYVVYLAGYYILLIGYNICTKVDMLVNIIWGVSIPITSPSF